MDFIILGAGAVGCVVGTLLEADGHRVRYLARPARALQRAPFVVERVPGSSVRSALPSCLGAKDSLRDADWVLVCVRGEQLDAAYAEIIARGGADCSVAVAAISLDSVVERARRAGLTGTVLAYHVSFGAFRDPERPQCFTWFPFATPSTVTPEGDRTWLEPASKLAKLIDHAGLPTRSARSRRQLMAALVALNSVLTLSWALCGWDLPRLMRDVQLRAQTAMALREGLRVCGLQSAALRLVAALLPLGLYSLVLRGLARFMGARGREVWRHHGPKISAQTDYIVRDLLARANAAALPLAALPKLFARWQAAQAVAPSAASGAADHGATVPVT